MFVLLLSEIPVTLQGRGAVLGRSKTVAVTTGLGSALGPAIRGFVLMEEDNEGVRVWLPVKVGGACCCSCRLILGGAVAARSVLPGS